MFTVGRRGDLCLLTEHYGSTSSTAVVVRQFDAVEVRFEHFGVLAEDFGDFVGGHVLAAPAECVADAVGEIPAALKVPAHNVAGTEPHIPLPQHVAHYLALCRTAVVEIALEGRLDVRGVELEEELARLSPGDLLAETRLGIAPRLFSLIV
ncbi:hypothetical protein ACKS0A_08607 [Histoplasma ohiense]